MRLAYAAKNNLLLVTYVTMDLLNTFVAHEKELYNCL